MRRKARCAVSDGAEMLELLPVTVAEAGSLAAPDTAPGPIGRMEIVLVDGSERLTRSNAGASRAAPGELRRHFASRRVRRLQSPLSRRLTARPDRRGAVLEPCAPQVLRIGRHRRQRLARAEGGANLADCVGGRQTDRRALRHRARDQWPFGRDAAGRAPAKQRRGDRLARRLDTRRLSRKAFAANY